MCKLGEIYTEYDEKGYIVFDENQMNKKKLFYKIKIS